VNLLFLDLEMNQPSDKIIQIGYVIVDMMADKILLDARIYVNPEEVLNPRIIELTGISQEQVDSAPLLAEAYKKVCSDVKEHKIFMNPITWGGGDSQCLRTQLGLDQEKFIFGRRWIDTKTLYVAYSIHKKLPYAGGLKKCMSRFNIPFVGRAHDALVDATNTYTFYKHLLTLFDK